MSDIIVPHPNKLILKNGGKLYKKNKNKYENTPSIELSFSDIPIKKDHKDKIYECSKSINYRFPDKLENCFSKIKSIKKLESYNNKPVSVKKHLNTVNLDCTLTKIDSTFDWPDPEPTQWKWESEYTHSE